jgi:hypothetical protein
MRGQSSESFTRIRPHGAFMRRWSSSRHHTPSHPNSESIRRKSSPSSHFLSMSDDLSRTYSAVLPILPDGILSSLHGLLVSYNPNTPLLVLTSSITFRKRFRTSRRTVRELLMPSSCFLESVLGLSWFACCSVSQTQIGCSTPSLGESSHRVDRSHADQTACLSPSS